MARLKINARTKYLKVTEVVTFPDGSVRLVLADGRELAVARRTRVYSSARVTSGEIMRAIGFEGPRWGDEPHRLRVDELAGRDSIAF